MDRTNKNQQQNRGIERAAAAFAAAGAETDADPGPNFGRFGIQRKRATDQLQQPVCRLWRLFLARVFWRKKNRTLRKFAADFVIVQLYNAASPLDESRIHQCNHGVRGRTT